jgi:hypothetical protein
LVLLCTLPINGRAKDSNDLPLYYDSASRLLQGQIPYRDFPLEYPPLALVPFTLPYLASFGQSLAFDRYVWLYLIESTLLSTSIALVLMLLVRHWQSARRVAPALGAYALFVAVSAPVLPWRYDLFPALLTQLALLCVLAGHPTWAGLWVGFGAAAKLYPIVLLPIFGAHYLASKDYRALRSLLLGSSGAIAMSLLPFVLVAPEAWFSFLEYHRRRGLQIESLPAGALSLAHVLGLTEASIVSGYGGAQLVAPQADLALEWQPIVLVLAYGVVLMRGLARFRRERAIGGASTAHNLVTYIVAALLAFIATNKVFSPQYMIWLLPFAPLLRPRHSGLLLTICAMTTVIYPFAYSGLEAMRAVPLLLLNLRNVLVVVLLVWLLVERSPILGRTAFPRPRGIRP